MMSKRALVGISLLMSFLVLVVSGTYMYFGNHDYVIVSMHHVFSIVFILVVVFHFISNKRALKNYATKNSNWMPSMTLTIVLLLTTVILLGVFMKFPAFQKLYTISETYAAQSFRTENTKSLEFIKIEKNQKGNGEDIEVILKRGSYFDYPTYAIWLEDTAGNYIQTLYVTEKLAKDNFSTHAFYNENDELQFEYKPETTNERSRKESLPVWIHAYKKSISLHSDVPSGDSAVPDAYSGATIFSEFIMKSKTNTVLPDAFMVCMEINHSFDWNDFYSEDRFPNDPVYSGSGFVGQPSLIYKGLVSKKTGMNRVFLQPVGRGHHSGVHGEIIEDMSNMTTALELIDWVMAAYIPG